MKTQRIRNEEIADTNILVRDPAFQDRVLDHLHTEAARALMRMISDGNVYGVRRIDKAEQMDNNLTTLFSTTIIIGELVQCKDCRHNPKKDKHSTECPCSTTGDPFLDWIPDDNWFCADGEREEE